MLHFCEICEILGKMSTLSFDKYQFVLFLALYPLYKRQFSTMKPIFGTLRTQLGVQKAGKLSVTCSEACINWAVCYKVTAIVNNMDICFNLYPCQDKVINAKKPKASGFYHKSQKSGVYL